MKATAQIFLSYARLDEEKVQNLYQKLSDAGFKPWMDTKDLLPGERWKSSIQKAIQHSDFFPTCLSANSVSKRGFLQKEIKDALDIWQEMLDSDIYLIPVRLEDCEVPERLRDFQWVNLFEENGWTRLVKAIQVGMERRAEVAKRVVQQSTPFEPHPAHEKLSPGTEMATPEEGPEQVRTKVLIFLAKLIGVRFVQENYVAPVFRLGLYNRVCGPGFFWVIPILESVGQPVKRGLRFTSLHAPSAISSDSIPIDIDLEIFFRFDPKRTEHQIAAQLVRVPERVLTDIATGYADSFLRRIVANFTAEEIYSGKAIARIKRQLSRILADKLEFLGYVIDFDTGVLIKSIIASPEFQQTMLDAKRYEVTLRVLSAYQTTDVDRVLLAELVS